MEEDTVRLHRVLGSLEIARIESLIPILHFRKASRRTIMRYEVTIFYDIISAAAKPLNPTLKTGRIRHTRYILVLGCMGCETLFDRHDRHYDYVGLSLTTK
jgi:hypothetical protein